MHVVKKKSWCGRVLYVDDCTERGDESRERMREVGMVAAVVSLYSQRAL